MLRHVLGTTSEAKVEECLERCASEHLKAFVKTTRIRDDPLHVRYDIFVFVPNEREG
ncbi:MAG: hypothetical protein ACE5H4_06905 [Candidatus Thorarchaeota archaeon]